MEETQACASYRAEIGRSRSRPQLFLTKGAR